MSIRLAAFALAAGLIAGTGTDALGKLTTPPSPQCNALQNTATALLSGDHNSYLKAFHYYRSFKVASDERAAGLADRIDDQSSAWLSAHNRPIWEICDAFADLAEELDCAAFACRRSGLIVE